MRFNSRGTKATAAAELPTAHISHLQHGSGPRLSGCRAQALSFRRIQPSAVDFCAPGRVCARAPAVRRLGTLTAVRLKALSGSYEGTHKEHYFLFLKFTLNPKERKTFVSVFCSYKDEPKRFPRTLLEVSEDGRAGRPLTGWAKDGDGETVPPVSQLREREKRRRTETAPRLNHKQHYCCDTAGILTHVQMQM